MTASAETWQLTSRSSEATSRSALSTLRASCGTGARGGGPNRVVGRDDIVGLYDVGEASFNLSDAQPLEVTTPMEGHLRVRLDEHTTLEIVEQSVLP